ncbi:MAG: hypothetical protein EXS08_09175 [Planctomycetes bacterium]|nr:hypothetical protein [Planctomycetota bacterium]
MKTTLLFLALGVSALPRVQTVELVARHAQGDVFEEQESFWSSAAGAAQDDASNQPSFAWGADARVASAEGFLLAKESTVLDEVLEVKDGVRVKVRRTFVASASTTLEPQASDATPQRTHAPFEGQTVILVADERGTRIVGELDGEEQLSASDLSLSTRWEQLLPAAPIAVGESWPLPEAVAQRLLEGLEPAKASGWCKLTRVEVLEGVSLARIQLELRATATPELGRTRELEASGVVLWNVAGGHLAEVALTGELHATDADGLEQKRAFGLTRAVRRIE